MDRSIPLTEKGRRMLQELGLEPGATFRQAANRNKSFRVVTDESSFQDQRNATEGMPVARQIVEQHDSGNLVLHTVVEPAPPGFEHEPGPFERSSVLAQDTAQVNSGKPTDK